MGSAPLLLFPWPGSGWSARPTESRRPGFLQISKGDFMRWTPDPTKSYQRGGNATIWQVVEVSDRRPHVKIKRISGNGPDPMPGPYSSSGIGASSIATDFQNFERFRDQWEKLGPCPICEKRLPADHDYLCEECR